MSGLTVRGRKLALEISSAIDDGDTRRVLGLVESYGLPDAEQRNVARALHAPSGDEVTFVYDKRDQAHVRDLPAVWRQARA